MSKFASRSEWYNKLLLLFEFTLNQQICFCFGITDSFSDETDEFVMANREESDKEEDLDEEDMQNLHIDGKYQMRKLNYIFQTIINFCITFFNR